MSLSITGYGTVADEFFRTDDGGPLFVEDQDPRYPFFRDSQYHCGGHLKSLICFHHAASPDVLRDSDVVTETYRLLRWLQNWHWCLVGILKTAVRIADKAFCEKLSVL